MKIARGHSGLIMIVVSALLLAACGAPTTSPGASTTPSGSAAATNAPSSAAPSSAASTEAETETTTQTATSGDGTFPVTIEHKYGRTEILQQPTRVVSVGFIDQDAILALGVVPVGIRDWYGDQPQATWPWAQDKLGGATPAVLPANALNFEQIASLNPDLIIGISSGMTEQDYATLSQIAPTVAQSGEYIDYGVPWQEGTRVIGTALGRSEQAEALVADVDAQFADARTQNPAFEGASGVVAASFNGEYSAYGPQDVRGRLLESLGFVTPEEITSLAGASFYTSISRERVDLLDTDVLVWVVSTDAERQAIENDALYQRLNVAREQRAVFLDQELSGAASFSSVLSLPFLLERFVPQLAAAVDGDPQTTATATAATPEPDATQAAGDTRTVTHAMGTTTIPTNPQRVVVLDTGELDTALALGVTPVGAVEAIAGEGYQAYFGDATDGIENVGTIAEPNLETIVRLQPDLILSNKVRHEDIYEQLSQIAPTVFAERVGVAWKENFMLHADALGKAAEAEAMMAEYNARVTELKAQIGDPQATEVSIVRFLPEQIRLYQRGSFIGTILDDVGFARPLSQQATDETWLEGNKERIGDMDGDIVFVTYYGDETAQVVNDFKADPLWAQLSAVQNNNVYDVSDDHWMLGIGMLAANRVLDDLETYVVQP